MNLAKCKTCGASIRWVKMLASGSANPLDAEPSEKGNVMIQGDRGITMSRDEAPDGEPLYLSHFATCPHSKEHRRKGSQA